MKAKFSIRENLYAICEFEVECESEEEVEKALIEIGDCVSAEALENELRERFGDKNVKSDGVNETYNIESAGEYEFWDWE